MYIPEELPETFIFLHAFKKDCEDTPPNEITKARNKKLKHKEALQAALKEQAKEKGK